MELLSGTSLTKYLLKKYSKNPRGWNFTVAPSAKDAFFDALVTSPDESWQLKIDSIFKPSPIIMGAKIESVDVDKTKIPGQDFLPSYGYRSLDPEAILKLLQEKTEESEPSRGVSYDLDRILRSIEPTTPIAGQAYAQGPFVFTNQKITRVSENQTRLDDKLASEIRNLLRNKYLSYG